MADSTSRCALALGVGLLAGVGVLGVRTAPLRLEPGTAAWERVALGFGRDGSLHDRAVVRLPGVDRGAPRQLLVEAWAPDAALFELAVDRGPFEPARLARGKPGVWIVPRAATPGLRLDLRTLEGAGPLVLRSLTLRRPAGLPWLSALSVFALAGLVAVVLLWRLSRALALALGLVVSGALTLSAVPLMLLWTAQSPASWLRLAVPAASIASGCVLAARARELRRFSHGSALILAAVFGVWVRVFFLPSPGAWDVEYWKACATRVGSHGVTRAYGDPVPPGHFLPQLTGQEPAWELEAFGQSFVVDQPPAIQALWGVSWWCASRARGSMGRSEALNVAAKLPATLGDVLAVVVLLLAFRHRLGLGSLLAALYWGLPISWLSSAVLGFFDGAAAPVAVAALVAAGRGRALLAGATLAAAALVKATALLVAPAVAVALWADRASLRRAVAAGTGVVLLVLLPFALDGTLGAAFVHIYRIIFQERLSGGFANVWWLTGAVLAARDGSFTWSDPIPFVRLEALALPARTLGSAAMVSLVAFLVWRQHRHPGPRVAALAGFVLVFGYGMLAVGVHENHPHALVLTLLATGLTSRRLRWVAAGVLTTYTLNLAAFSGLGRFYGQRFMALEPLVAAVSSLRVGLGFDLTLLLLPINLAAFAWLLASLESEMAGLAERGSGC